MAKKTSLPAGFTSKTNYQTLSGIPAGQKVNASNWNLGIQDLADTVDENYERLVLNWTNDIVADQVLALGQYIDKDNVIYRVTTGYDVSDPKTFTAGNFQALSEGPEVNTWYVNSSASGGNGTPQNPYTVDEAMAAASERDVIYFQSGTYTDDITVTKDNLTFVGQAQDVCKIDVTNFVIDTDAQVIFFVLQNLNISTSNGITQGTNLAVVVFQNCRCDFNDDIIIDRVSLYNSYLSISGNLTMTGRTTTQNTRIQCTNWTIGATSSFYNSTINSNISAVGQTLTFHTCKVDGDVNCANLTYNNTTITGTKVGTSSTTVNNQFYDNKIWYVNLNDGDDTNSGLNENAPLLTLQEAIDLREADAVAHGIIQILTPGVISGINFPASTKTTTLICTPGQNSNNITLTVTDYTFLFIINGSINITFIQTGSNTCKIQTTACSITLSADAVINDPTEAFLILTNNTLGSLLRSFNGYLIVKFSYLQIQGSIFGDITINRLKIEIQAEVEVKNGTNTFTTFELFRAKLTMSSGLTLNIGTFTDTGAIFQINGAALNVTGTRTSITGEFESPHPKSLNKEITADQTVVSNVEFLGQASANDDTIQTFSATPTFDFDNGNDQEMPVTGNITTFSTSNSVGSANYKVWLINDATAGRTVAAPTGWTKAASSDDHDTAANAINLYQFFTRPGGQKYYSILNM